MPAVRRRTRAAQSSATEAKTGTNESEAKLAALVEELDLEGLIIALYYCLLRPLSAKLCVHFGDGTQLTSEVASCVSSGGEVPEFAE